MLNRLAKIPARHKHTFKLTMLHVGVAMMALDGLFALGAIALGEHVAHVCGACGATIAGFASYLE